MNTEKNTSSLEYAENKLDKVGLKNVPISEIFSENDLQIARKVLAENSVSGMIHIMAIAFANGVEFARKEK